MATTHIASSRHYFYILYESIDNQIGTVCNLRISFDRVIPICSKLMHRGEQCYWNNYLLHCVWRFNVSGRLVFRDEGCQGE